MAERKREAGPQPRQHAVDREGATLGVGGADVVLTFEEAAGAPRAPLLVLRPLERFPDERGLGEGPLEVWPLGAGHSNPKYAARREHPDVVDAAVIGLSDETWGERVCAVVEARSAAEIAEEEVIAFCRDQLASYKKPSEVRVIDELPRTMSGKPQKFKLRERFGGDRPRARHGRMRNRLGVWTAATDQGRGLWI